MQLQDIEDEVIDYKVHLPSAPQQTLEINVFIKQKTDFTPENVKSVFVILYIRNMK